MSAMNRVRHTKKGWFGLVLWLGMQGWSPGVFGQNEQEYYIDGMAFLEIENRMLYFYDQLNELVARIPQYTPEELDKADQQLLAIDTKWNVYYQSRQSEIAEDDSLLQIVANYQLTKQSLLDSIAGKRHFYEAQTAFTQAEAFFPTQDTLYKQLYERAFKYSLVKAMGEQLEQIKTQEQALFAEVQRQYDHAKDLAQEFARFQARFQPIEKEYLELKNTSEKIQALEFKPWLQRVKDYLYSFAAVAMILMFINMLQAKLKTLKQARENAKKLRQMLQDDQNDYPTI